MTHNIKPGDVIEWVYVIDGVRVVHNEQCYSSTMERWIPIGGDMIVISIVGSVIYFLRKEGLFHACVDEAGRGDRRSPGVRVVPHVRGWVVPRVKEQRYTSSREVHHL